MFIINRPHNLRYTAISGPEHSDREDKKNVGSLSFLPQLLVFGLPHGFINCSKISASPIF